MGIYRYKKITLSISNPSGQDAIIKYYNVANDKPIASFMYYDKNGGYTQMGDTIMFVNTSSNIGDCYWNFGQHAKPNNSTKRDSIIVVFDTITDVNIDLTVTNEFGSSDCSKSIYLQAPTPLPDFCADKYEVYTYDTVTFYNKGKYALEWRWSFGFNSNPSNYTSTKKDSIKVFWNDAGEKSISLIGIYKNESSIINRRKYIKVKKRDPKADFYSIITNFKQGDTVTFYDNSQFCDSYKWKFLNDDAEIITSNEKNAKVIFHKTGKKDIKLIVTGDNGIDSITKYNYININQGNVIADFTIDKNTIYPGQEVTVFNNSKYAKYYSWNFGSHGNPKNTTGPGPHKVVYNDYGFEAIQLTASNDISTDFILKSKIVEVVPRPIVPSIECSLNKISIDQYVIVESISKGDIIDHRWSFSDDAVPDEAYGKGPHLVKWNSPGEKYIKLTVENEFDIKYDSVKITVNSFPVTVISNINNKSLYQIHSNQLILKSTIDHYMIFDINGRILLQGTENIIKLDQIKTDVFILTIEHNKGYESHRIVNKKL
jgi:PKD repeat protein